MSSEVVLKRLISIGKSELKLMDRRKTHGLLVPLLLYQSLDVWYSEPHETHQLENTGCSPFDEEDDFEYLECLTEFHVLQEN